MGHDLVQEILLPTQSPRQVQVEENAEGVVVEDVQDTLVEVTLLGGEEIQLTEDVVEEDIVETTLLPREPGDQGSHFLLYMVCELCSDTPGLAQQESGKVQR